MGIIIIASVQGQRSENQRETEITQDLKSYGRKKGENSGKEQRSDQGLREAAGSLCSFQRFCPSRPLPQAPFTALQGTGQGGSLDHHCLLELDRLGIPIWGSELVALCLEPLTTFLSLDFSLGERGPEQLYQGSLRASLRWCSGGSQQSTGGSVSP